MTDWTICNVRIMKNFVLHYFSFRDVERCYGTADLFEQPAALSVVVWPLRVPSAVVAVRNQCRRWHVDGRFAVDDVAGDRDFLFPQRYFLQGVTLTGIKA